jgi:hypothetical protein
MEYALHEFEGDAEEHMIQKVGLLNTFRPAL